MNQAMTRLSASAADQASIGIDMGGTFVDCVVVRPGGGLIEAKAPTTPADPTVGIMAALRGAAAAAGQEMEELLGQAATIVHGTTLGVNTLLDRSGGRVGVLATRGHEDAILIGRVHQKVAGLRPDEIVRVAELRKPPPLVPRWDIVGIDERIDAEGRVVVALDEAGVVAAVERLSSAGCGALVVAFLWSHLRPDHEKRAAELASEIAPGLPIVCSSDIAPVLGEYERTAAAVVNASLLSRFSGYLERLGGALCDSGFRGRLWIMGMTGGVVPADVASRRPVHTIRSGPVGGIMATSRIGERMGKRRLIAADMGGTSFDVGLLIDGEPQQTDLTLVGQFHLAIPGVDVRSIGAGGGSIAWLDELGGLHVGPRSAGSDPGPAAYGRGGHEPTVTDADVVLGRLDPAIVLGGTISLDSGAAARAVGTLAARIGLSQEETAAGIVRVADAQMADLIRASTLERGHDPRDFTLVAYGGAGPVHVGRFGADVGVSQAIIPASAAVLSALGLARASYRRTYRRSSRMRLPLQGEDVQPLVEALIAAARSEFADSGFDGELVITPWADMRYRRQTHELRVPSLLDDDGRMDLAILEDEFEAMYARTFGAGTGYAAAGIEVGSIGIHATAERAFSGIVAAPAPTVRRQRADGAGTRRRRRVWFDDWIEETPIFEASQLASGPGVDGPAVVEMSSAALLVHPGQRAAIDGDGNGVLDFAPARP